MIALTAAEEAAISAGMQRVGIFFRLEVPDDPVNLWFGVGDVIAGVYDDDGDEIPTLFYSRGVFADVPALQQLINGAADRVTFALAGVSDEAMRLVGEDKDLVRQARCRCGVALFDQTWQILGPVKWLFTGYADYVSQGIDSLEDGTFSNHISVSVGTRWTGRRRPQNSHLTDTDQQRRSPGDRFCERTVLYTTEFKKTWPVFSA